MANVTTHVGLCVTDVDASRRFYEGALGFTFDREISPPDDLTSTLLEVPAPVGLRAVYLTMGPFTLELLHFDRGANPPARRRVFNEPGLTHLSLTVDDLPATLAKVRELGGEVVEATDIGVAVLVRDPDGQLVELLRTRG
jgi:catechol 2,3-dioxygenase-like lactoylglutathione lyase family enzyme